MAPDARCFWGAAKHNSSETPGDNRKDWGMVENGRKDQTDPKQKVERKQVNEWHQRSIFLHRLYSRDQIYLLFKKVHTQECEMKTFFWVMEMGMVFSLISFVCQDMSSSTGKLFSKFIPE